MNMTTDHSTYTYEGGEQETVTLSRGPITPHGHALLLISYSDGRRADCYVNTAWLRDRLNDLDPRPLAPDAITDEMVERARAAAWGDQTGDYWVRKAREVLVAGLTEPPSRPDGAADIEVELTGLGPLELDNPLSAREQTAIADFLAERGVRVVERES